MADKAADNFWWSKPWRLHIGICAFAVTIVLVFGNPLESQELQWFGQCLRLRFRAGLAPPVERTKILHLNIETKDLENLHTIKSEYEAAARIVREASVLGASVIAFDIIFARADAETAQPLLNAINEHKNVVLAEAVNAEPGEDRSSLLVRSFPFRNNIPASGGLINVAADPDGVIRHYGFAHRIKSDFRPSLALAAYLKSLGVDWNRHVSFPQLNTVQWSEWREKEVTTIQRRVPVNPVLLNLRCPWSVQSGPAAFDYMNLRELDVKFTQAGDHALSKPLIGKIVFVSYVALGEGDLGPTVFGSHEPLIYLHSTALNDLMQSRWLQRSGRFVDALWLLSALLVLAGARWCRSKGALVLWWMGGVALMIALGGAFLFWLNLVVPTVATASLWTIATVLEIARRHTSELAERQRLRSTMGLYFSPRVLEDVLKNPGRLEPKRVEITVLLTDLRNSTALAEQLGTEGMLNLLNRIFTAENSAVFTEEGSMEKPVGDQFLAYWGAPDPQPDAADRALRAAFAVIEGMQKLRETFDSQTRELFGYGVALHAGESLIANIGSAQFFHYGPVGDLMNATARVESLTKYYGVLALATRDFCNRLSHPPQARTIDRVVVKGKSVPLELIEIRHPCSSQTFAETTTAYSEAFALYQDGKFAESERMFRAMAQSDKPSAVMADRCAEFLIGPPPEWRGIFTLPTK